MLLLLLVVIANSDPAGGIVPTKFGILTLTHRREKSNFYFQEFVDYYARLKCRPLQEVSVVWNNEESPEEHRVFEGSKGWNKPVHFQSSPANSLAYRFNPSPLAVSEVFLTIDDDVRLSCRDMIKGFEKWRREAVGAVGPLAGFVTRSYRLAQDKSYLLDFDVEKLYSFELTAAAFVSRHFMDLFNSQLGEAKALRQVVEQSFNCEDLAMNFLVSHFYPELRPLALHARSLKIYKYPAQLFSRPNHLKDRDRCLNSFTNFLGYNPVRQFQTNLTSRVNDKTTKALFASVVAERHKQLAQLLRGEEWAAEQLEILEPPIPESSEQKLEKNQGKADVKAFSEGNEELFVEEELVSEVFEKVLMYEYFGLAVLILFGIPLFLYLCVKVVGKIYRNDTSLLSAEDSKIIHKKDHAIMIDLDE